MCKPLHMYMHLSLTSWNPYCKHAHLLTLICLLKVLIYECYVRSIFFEKSKSVRLKEEMKDYGSQE